MVIARRNLDAGHQGLVHIRGLGQQLGQPFVDGQIAGDPPAQPKPPIGKPTAIKASQPVSPGHAFAALDGRPTG